MRRRSTCTSRPVSCSQLKELWFIDFTCIIIIHVPVSRTAIFCKLCTVRTTCMYTMYITCCTCSLCLALTGLSQRQASLAVREVEMEREEGRREGDIRHAVVTQATQKQ